MKVKLIRNLNSNRNKEQEDSFEQTMNLALYFDINKTINKVDGWKISNIKKLIRASSEINSTIDIEFTKWNEQVELITNELNYELIEHFKLEEDIKFSLRNGEYNRVYEYLKTIKDDKNLKVEFLYYVASIIKNDNRAALIINDFVNGGISTLDVAIDSILPLLMMEDNNE